MALNSSRDRDSGLTSLLADVLRSEATDDELLVRYADDPSSLAAEDRARIERELESSAALRDQLRVLKQFDLTAALAAAPEALPELGPAAAIETPGLLQRVLALFRGRLPMLLVPLAGAALLAIALLRSGAPELRAPGMDAPGPIAKVEPPQPPVPPLPSNIPEPTPVTPVAPLEPAPQPVEVAKAPPPKPAPAPPPPKARLESPPPELDYVAMAEPVYRTPFDAQAFEGGETYIRAAGAGVTLAALAPRHVARTISARPALLWYLSALPDGSPNYVLTVANDDDLEPLLQVPLAAPAKAGLQRVALADLGVDLPLGKAFRWSIALKRDPENPSRDVIAQGAIERIAEPDGLAEKVRAATPLDRASVYAAAGIWYDALAELDRVARAAPDEAVPRARLRSLLESAGLPDAARIAD